MRRSGQSLNGVGRRRFGVMGLAGPHISGLGALGSSTHSMFRRVWQTWLLSNEQLFILSWHLEISMGQRFPSKVVNLTHEQGWGLVAV